VSRETTRRIRYGGLPSQFVEMWPEPDGRARGVIVSLHGGWWRARHDLHLNDPLCSALAADGWLTANVEYRRIDGDGGGWPQTLTDVLEAIDAVLAEHPDRIGGPVVTIGHSAGGHLALLASSVRAVSAAIGLAPVTDVARCAAEGLGEGAAKQFLTDANDETAGEASPIHRLPLGVPRLIVHGDQDQRVPVEHSRDYMAAARATGDDVTYAEIAGTDHFQVIDPTHHSFLTAKKWLDARFGPT
jgi:acetyl esterase/lipase